MKTLLFSGSRTFLIAAAAILITLPGVGHGQSNTGFSNFITQPADHSTFTAPTNVLIGASVNDPGADVSYVSFTAGPPAGSLAPVRELGVVSNWISLDPPERIYEFDWSNALEGTWLLVATAFRTNGTAVASKPVQITVQNNSLLSVEIASPTNGSFFPEATNIELIADVVATNGGVAYVEFFDDLHSIGIATNWAVLDPPGPPGFTPGTRAYFFDWTNQPDGTHVLTATATDTNGNSVSSAPVTITVQGSILFSVTITSPTNDAAFPGPTNIDLIANVTVTNDSVTNVEFLDGSQPIGDGAVVDLSPMGHIYLFDWTTQSPGTHIITAIATDTNGETESSVQVTILVGGETNPPPSVVITQPTNDSTFLRPTNIEFEVSVNDPDEDVATVSFAAVPGGLGPRPEYVILLGVVSNWTSPDPPTRIYMFDWSNAIGGTWLIVAGVVRSNGTYAGSASVQITVETATNLPPVVRITSPPDMSVFRAPVSVPLLAFAQDPDGPVQSVEFFAGSNSLGFGHPVPILLPVDDPVSPADPISPLVTTNLPGPILLGNTFELVWSNAQPGDYALTALALDDDGASATSPPVNITIEPASPPPTNLPAVVGIVATDPIAIAGTNCWPWLGGPLTWSNWFSPAPIWRWRTNCGPTDATFTVSRRGSTNTDLTVNYAIGGTATNGGNYAPLPGGVTIPAGQCEATITVVPIVDTAPDVRSTVILTLEPTTNSPVDYVPGFPRSAEAIIIENLGPLPEPEGTVLPDRSFHLCLPGPDGAWFHIDYSTDLINWTPVCTNQVINGSIDFIDPDAATSPAREYRAVPIGALPPD